MFAQSIPDLGMSESLLFIVRIILMVGGAVVGWFVFDPITRGVYRLIYRSAAPGSLLLGMKFIGAGVLATILYFVPLGGSGTGFGFGGPGGLGKGEGDGKGQPSPKTDPGKAKVSPHDPKLNPKIPPGQLEAVEIKIIRRDDYKEDDRFYILKGFDMPLTIEELDDYVKRNAPRIEIVPIFFRDSIGEGVKNNPMKQLTDLKDKYKVKILIPKMKTTDK